MRIRPTLLTCATVFSIAPAAFAQEEPAGLSAQAPATSGANEIAAEGFQSAAAPEPESADATSFQLSAGGLLATGNSRSLSLTGAAHLKHRKGIHQLGAVGAANFGRSAPAVGEPMETTVENYQGRLRYDVFFADKLAAFLQVTGRQDRFQGLLLRLNIDPGLAYYFIDTSKEQLSGEVGYDLQHDIRRDGARVLSEADELLDKTATRHNARLYVGYDNKLNESVAFSTGLEYLQGLSPYEDADSGNANWRLNWDAGLTAKVAQSFSIATTISVKYDNNPLPGLETTDTITAVNLVYDLY